MIFSFHLQENLEGRVGLQGLGHRLAGLAAKPIVIHAGEHIAQRSLLLRFSETHESGVKSQEIFLLRSGSGVGTLSEPIMKLVHPFTSERENAFYYTFPTRA